MISWEKTIKLRSLSHFLSSSMVQSMQTFSSFPISSLTYCDPWKSFFFLFCVTHFQFTFPSLEPLPAINPPHTTTTLTTSPLRPPLFFTSRTPEREKAAAGPSLRCRLHALSIALHVSLNKRTGRMWETVRGLRDGWMWGGGGNEIGWFKKTRPALWCITKTTHTHTMLRLYHSSLSALQHPATLGPHITHSQPADGTVAGDNTLHCLLGLEQTELQLQLRKN